MNLTAEDREQIERYERLGEPTPEAQAFLAQLPRRVRERVVNTILREMLGGPDSVTKIERMPENAALAIWPNGLPWR